MLLGIDYGTTRTVVAAVDRGNYPVVSFQTESGDAQEWYPSLLAERGGELLYGPAAAARQNEPGWALLRSFKRRLAALGPESEVSIGRQKVGALDLLTQFLAQLRRDLAERSNLRLKTREKLAAMISVPANSNSNQRFMTIEAFRRAGFEVAGLINEPSAAGIEYAHRFLGDGAPARREHVVVYDLGGGTFDASVIDIAERRHEVVRSEGVARLGGDDFDQLLLDLALDRAGLSGVPETARERLLEECREKKEGLHPNTRKLAIDLSIALEGAGEVVVSTADFYDRCQPLIERTVEVMEQAMRRSPGEAASDWRSVAAIYLVGGSSELPAVARLLRERYGRNVRKSPYPHASAAIGLAIAADAGAGYTLRERFTRHFGVWREAEAGREIAFDVLFEKDTPLPANGQPTVTRARRYLPAHNLGHFRYLECGGLGAAGEPTGDLTPWDEIYFPFDPALEGEADLKGVPVARAPLGEGVVEEIYSCDRNGIIAVEIVNHATGARRSYRLRGKR